MTFAPVGDLARHLLLQRHTTMIKADVNKLTEMLGSGRKSDLAASTAGNLRPLAAVESRLTQLDSWSLAAEGLSTKLDAMQSAFTALSGLGEISTNSFLLAEQPYQLERASREAFEHLEAALGHLNTKIAGDSIFAGTRADGPAVGSASDLLDALVPIVTSKSKAEDIEEAILTWMSDSAGFATSLYRGNEPTTAITLSAQESFAHGITATNPGLTKLLSGLAMGALLERGILEGNRTEQLRLGDRTAELLLTSANDTVNLVSDLGQSQAKLSRITTTILAERVALRIERNDMLLADPEKTASDITQATTQLELLYAMTARLSTLSLLNALR